jgi:predicted nucleic acid-binding protein
MIVVADTTPVNYLIPIDAIGVLEPLYKAVVIPEMVFSELSQPGTPAEVRIWIENRPTWLDVAPYPPPLPEPEALDPGERAAIGLALALPAGRLLIDDAAGRVERSADG